ncbi:hypothetical protein EHQ53_11130 [Leptospira langatensis]|uniref:Immunity protein 19 n=1 Tax=Leptospira langatensis TaxID=2484983 RepID=A0A5F1ZRX9_9LEPT|nr:Imm19 family immunity protein [Leptospira langatensis]TGJ98895.1 hypothetical protein EHO57_15370 [Leptospira langatensis]TGL40538.1 hypothetical protein EHQ53_11130 [Leptospira langatensis]
MRYNALDFKYDNNVFWCYYFSTSFPNAYNKSLNLTIGEIIGAIYGIDLDSKMDWINNFTGYHEGVIEEHDGYLDDPNFVEMRIKKSINLKIEFHPGDTLYFINNFEIGSTGPHWMLYGLTWNELVGLTEGAIDEGILFWLLLPMVGLSSEDDSAEVKKVLQEKIRMFPAIASNAEVFNLIDTIMIGLQIENAFSEIDGVGVVCNHANSFRNLRNDNRLNIIQFNKLLSTAEI